MPEYVLSKERNRTYEYVHKNSCPVFRADQISYRHIGTFPGMKEAYASVRDGKAPIEWCRRCADEVEVQYVACVEKDAGGDIIALGVYHNENKEYIIPVPRMLAKAELEDVSVAYWCEDGDTEAWVRVKPRDNSYYLTTEKDNSRGNNLLSDKPACDPNQFFGGGTT